MLDLGIGIDVVEETVLERNSNTKVAIISDIHCGALTWKQKMAEDAFEELKKLWWIGGGDYFEFGTKHSVGKGVYEQKLNPDQQKHKIKTMMKPARKKCLGLHEGNHDVRNKDGGMTELVNLCEYLDVPFLNSHAYHTVRVKDHEWRILTTHGTSGAKLPHTKINACKELAQNYGEADIYAMGHVHRLEVYEKFNNSIVTVDGSQRIKREREPVHILTGSFMDYIGSYAQKKGLYPEPAGYPILHFKKDGTMEVELKYADDVIIT